MAIFGFGKGKNKEQHVEVTFPVTLGAAASGTFVPMEKIPDAVFSAGVLGHCCGIEPEKGEVYAPVDGKITQLTDTLHAVGMEIGGVEILIHVGVDTVDMNGDGFANAVKANQTVKKGDLLLTMDLDKIRAAGHPTTVIMAVTNTDEFDSVEDCAAGRVQVKDDVMVINK